MQDVNIIIFDFMEQYVKWLDPDLAEIEETTTEHACRKIKITYPYEREVITEDTKLWYQQGNKIYIPEINGITSCLYVINTEYEIDFWKENTITVEAEEVLTELNYDMISFKSGQNITVTTEKLEEWFGMFYDIEGMDPLIANRKIVSPEGIMSRMSLLRMIEEETGRVFITEYNNVENNIKRTLYLADHTTHRFMAKTETLDLNYNLESLEFIKSEEDTYNAMCPVFTTGSNVVTAQELSANPTTNVNTAVLNKAELRTENNPLTQVTMDLKNLTEALQDAGVTDGDTTLPSITQVDGDELLQQWLDYTVDEGQEIPMIIQQDSEGNTVTTQTWNAPFAKEAGELYIKYQGVNQTDYGSIVPYNISRSPVMYKCGKENTSETLMPAVYNELANSLLNKLMPSYELKVSVKDIQDLLGLDHLGYQVYETLQLRVPNFNYYLPCRITETKKNAHFPGENTIKIETEVTSIFDMVSAEIVSSDRIIGENETRSVFGGLLREVEEQVALPDRYITMAIRLTKAFTTTEDLTAQTQIVGTFDAVKNTYVFDDKQIQNLEKAIRKDKIEKGGLEEYYKLRDVEGNVYSVLYRDCAAMYIARNNIYIANETYYGNGEMGKGSFDDTLVVHYYENAKTLAKQPPFENSKKYYYAAALDGLNLKLVTGDTGYWYSSECQDGPTCLPASMSNITSVLHAYHTEYELAKLMGTTQESGTYRSRAEPVMEQLGFKIERVPATWENVKKYVKGGLSCINLSVHTQNLGPDYYGKVYQGNDRDGSHAISIVGWYELDNGKTKKVCVLDSNMPVFNPVFNTPYDENNAWVNWDDVLPAIYVTYVNGRWASIQPGYTTPYMSVVSQTTKLIENIDEVEALSTGTTTTSVNTGFEPELYNYKFNLDDIRAAIMDVMLFIRDSGLSLDIMSSSTNINTTSKVEMDNIGLWWLRAMALAGMQYYQEKAERTTNITIDVGPGTNAIKYYNHFSRVVDNVGAYDWFTPCKATDNAYQFGYICSTLLFHLGIPWSPYDFSAGSETYLSYDLIGRTVVDKAGTVGGQHALRYTVVDLEDMPDCVPVDNRLRDSFQDTVMFTWAFSSDLNTHATVKDTRYPLMCYQFDSQGNVYYQNILGTGNSSTRDYDTLTTAATSKNPWGATSMSNLADWHDAVGELLQDGDKGKALVISWYDLTELIE